MHFFYYVKRSKGQNNITV